MTQPGTGPLLSREARVGLFTLLGIALVFWATFQIGDFRSRLRVERNYTVVIDDAHGIGRDSTVEIAGIRIGRVRAITLDPETGQARLTLGVDSGVWLYPDARVFVRSSGLLGDRYLEIATGTPGSDRLPDGADLGTAVAPRSLEQLMDSLSPVVANVEAITEDIRRLTGDAAMAEDIRAAVTSLRSFSEGLEQVMGGSQSDLTATLANLAEITRVLRDDLPGLVRRADDGLAAARELIAEVQQPVTSAAERIDQLMARLDQTAVDLQVIVGDIREGRGVLGALLSDQSELGEDVQQLAGALGQTAERIQRMRTIVDYRGSYMLDGPGGGGGVRHHAGLRIQPAWDYWYGFAVVKRPEGRSSLVEIEQQHFDATGALTDQTTTIRIENEDVFLFNVQLAKRFWDITLRGGILENTGGFGIDWALWDDRIWLRSEAFDFGRRNDRPYLRGWAEVRLWKHLTITAGLEDVAGQRFGMRPAFGAGLTFDDEDLKLLFTALPSVSF